MSGEARSGEGRLISSEERDALDALAARYELQPGTGASLATLVTTLRDVDPEGHNATVSLIEQSLAALELDAVTAAGDVTDLGTDGGIPGLVLSLALADARVRFVDMDRTLCARISRAVEELGLRNVDVIAISGKVWAAEHPESTDLVITRNLSLVKRALDYGMMLRPDGRLVVWGDENSAHEAAVTLSDGSIALRLLDVKPAAAGRKELRMSIYGRSVAPRLEHVDLESRSPELLELSPGSHRRRDDGMCATEAVAWLAGEPHTDRPACLSTVLAFFLRALNDGLDATARQALTRYLPRCIGTAEDGKDDRRRWLAASWLIRVATPAWLDAAGLSERATSLRELPEIGSQDDLEPALPALSAARASAIAARARARESLQAASHDFTAYVAAATANSPVYAAAFTVTAADNVARTAADAAEAAAYMATDSATYGAEYPGYVNRIESHAARKAAEEAFRPTKQWMLTSTLELFEQMIDPGPAVSGVNRAAPSG